MNEMPVSYVESVKGQEGSGSEQRPVVDGRRSE
jgi:hypothetical protein